MSSEIRPVRRREVGALVEGAFRRSFGALVAHLTARFGTEHLALAEDVVQEAMLAALRAWPSSGVPERPEAWLFVVARNRMIDALRSPARKVTRSLDHTAPGSESPVDGLGDVDRLDLLLLIAGSSISTREAMALSLKVVFGFSVREIGRMLEAEAKSIEVRLYRGRRRLKDAGPLERARPDSVHARGVVLPILYATFTEGFANPLRPSPIQVDLAVESISLLESLIARPGWGGPECRALLALFYLQASRIPARIAGRDVLVDLERQDRSMWRRDWIRAGLEHLEKSFSASRVSRYHTEAAIAACYARTIDGSDPPWDRIATLYDELLEQFPSPTVALNRAIVLGELLGADVGLEELGRISAERALRNSFYLHAARARLLTQIGRSTEAREELVLACSLARAPDQRRFVEQRLAELTD